MTALTISTGLFSPLKEVQRQNQGHYTWRLQRCASRLRTHCSSAPTTEQSVSPSHGLPATYRRLIARRTGDTFRDVAEVEEVPLQLPGEGEVLVEVRYAGINGGCELFRARGDFLFSGNRDVSHYLLGAEGSGVVAAVGDKVTQCKVGDAATFGGGGAFSEYVRVKGGAVHVVDEATPAAVALALSGTVASTALQDIACVQSGEVVLVSAAAGGTGHLAVQVAREAGARVVAVTGRADKAQRLEALEGVERVINYRQEDVQAVLAAEYPQGINIAYEGVGGDIFKAAWQNLSAGGRLLLLGYISEYPHTGRASQCTSSVAGLPPLHTLFWNGGAHHFGDKTIYAQTLPKDRSLIPRRRKEMFDMYRNGRIQVWLDESAHFHGLEAIPAAVEHMLSGNTIGKVVVQIS